MKNLITALATLVLTMAAQAQLSQIGAVTSGGSGCLNSNIKVSVNSGGVTIVYPQFQLQADGSRTLVRSTCAVAVPVNVPDGFQLLASAVSSGLSRLQVKDRVALSQELFLAGLRGVPQAAILTETNRLFTLGKLNSANTLVKSACGQDTILRLNLSATAQLAAPATSSKLAINKSQITLRLVPCH
ncbi:MAG: DUF4360 domain-containing protein [Bdellovibrio sp.]|nr:DUF4360 domain-containing protein [Bdellovibrio sp.]